MYQMVSRDKDYRYMAASDLAAELGKEGFVFESSAMEPRVADAVLKLLDDGSSDISSLALKCLGLLVGRLSGPTLHLVVERLAAQALKEGTESAQEDAALGLKTVIGAVPADQGPQLAAYLSPKLTEGLASKNSSVGERSIDLLLDLLGRFARCVPAPEALADALIARLAVHRKKASQSLALLATAMTAAQLGGLLGALLEGASAPAQWRLQALGGVSKLVGWRFAPYAAPTVLLARGVLGATSDEGQEEVQEQCLQALEAVVAHCPAESRAVAADILGSALTYVRHDPNYQWESEEEEEGDKGGAAAGGSDDGAGMGSDEEEALSEEEYSDDEDLSWKVRSAAARLLRAAVEHRLVPLERLYEAVGGPLVARLREREPVVLLEVYGAYGALLGALRGAPAALAPVAADAPRVVRALDRQLAAPGPKAAKAGAEAYALLLQLLTALPAATAALLPRAFASIRSTLADASASVPTLKLVALQLLQRYLGLIAAADRAPDGLADVLRAVVRCAGEPYYRTAAESLRALEAAAPLALLGLGPAAPSPPLLPDAAVATLARLALSGEDQEVKEAATLAAAALLAHHGAELAQVGADATASIGALAQKFAAMPHAPKRAKLSGGEDEAQQQQLGGPIANEASRGGG